MIFINKVSCEIIWIFFKLQIANYNDEDLRRIEKERLEINAAYDNVKIVFNLKYLSIK
jgi:hypothetical protein